MPVRQVGEVPVFGEVVSSPAWVSSPRWRSAIFDCTTMKIYHFARYPAPLGAAISERGFLRLAACQSLSLWEQRRRPPPVAETGRSCWGRGQQDASGSEADAGSRNPGSFNKMGGVGRRISITYFSAKRYNKTPAVHPHDRRFLFNSYFSYGISFASSARTSSPRCSSFVFG